MTVTKKRSAAWRRDMKKHRLQAIGMLEQLGPNADHLPQAAQKQKHEKLTAALEHVVYVIDQHLREARPDIASLPPASPRSARIPGRGRPR
jgi:hypothetical protein